MICVLYKEDQWLVCLPLEPKIVGSNPTKVMDILRAIKIRCTPSFRWEVKPEAPCCKILWHIKDLLKSHRNRQTKFSFPSPILLLAPEMSLLTGLPDNTCGCHSAPADKSGVKSSRHHHTMVHIAITQGEQ
jgi:hypothetical protein